MARLAACWKRRVIVPTAAAVLACALSGCIGWFVQLSAPGTSLAGVACPSATTCVAVGTGATGALIERTTNAGGAWTQNVSGVSGPSLSAVACPSATACMAVGASGNVLVSGDGGSSWARSTVPDLPSGASLSSIACADAEHCWASVGITAPVAPLPSGALQPAGLIETTSDGGTTWHQETWPIPIYDGTYAGQVAGAVGIKLSVVCPSTSVCVGVGAVTYLIYPPPEATIPMLDTQMGVVVFTDDGGTSWSSLLVGKDWGALDALSCPSATTCLAVGENGVNDQAFDLSSGGGSSGWDVSDLPADSLLPDTAVDCLDATHCVAVGAAYDAAYGSPVLSTSDGGTTWHPQATADRQADLEGIDCVSASSCWAVGSDANGAVILHTVTGGEAWPSVTGVTPAQGPVTGGTTVTVTGVHFDLGVTSVAFGSVTTTAFTLDSATELTVTAPAASGDQPATVDVQVNSTLGTSPTTPDDQFTYAAG